MFFAGICNVFCCYISFFNLSCRVVSCYIIFAVIFLISSLVLSHLFAIIWTFSKKSITWVYILTHHFFFPFFLNFKTSFFVLLYFKSLTTLCTAMDRNILATRVFVWIFYVQRCFDSTQTILYVHSRWYIIDIKIFFLHVYRAFFVCCGKTKDVYLTSKTINLS